MFAARQMIVIYLLLDDLSLELVISDRESVKKNICRWFETAAKSTGSL